MKITIIGSGNIGSLLGSLLTGIGEDVTLVEIRDEIVNAVKKDGIHIDMSDGQSRHAMVKITSDVNSVGISDLVILAVKAYATRSALESARPVIGENTRVLSVQNGAGNIEAITEVLGDDARIIGGIFLCVVTPVEVNRLSWVVGTGGLKIGPANGKMTPEVDEIAAMFRRAGLDVEVSTRVQELIWNKLLLNTPLALATTLRITNDEFAAYPHARELIVRMARECVEVAKAKGITLDHPEDPVQPLLDTIQKFRDSGNKPKSSMLQDLERGRRTEIDAINGSIVREGWQLGIPTPVNEVMVMLVKTQEEKNCQ